MKNKPHIALVLLLALLSLSFSPVKRYIKKAELNVERGNLELARQFYEKALTLEPENIRANYGMGMMLCELLDNFSKALPYLEKANQPPVEDSLYDLMFALGKCYQHSGEFQKAINYFDRLAFVVDLEQEKDFQKELSKRKADCRYAMAHENQRGDTKIHVVNGGRTINTDMPEYVPVLVPGNRMIFTSKRKDDERERINYLDGKYFESMYLTEITPTGFKNTRRYTIPDQYTGNKKKSSNRHESVVSLSQDGKKLFTFKNGSIYEVDLSETASIQPRKLKTSLNKNIYENHAYLSADGRQLFFSVEAESSLGGTDLYLSSRNENGEWSTPQNLGEPINTAFDEDAPFLSDDGETLYFASTGHPGYGNFDLYKSKKLSDGKWGEPENLGKPLNSPGHDIFLVHDSLKTTGYFASGRNGGFGDMDIYKVIYLDRIDTSCSDDYSDLVSLEIRDADSNDYSNLTALNMPAGLKVLSYRWWLDGREVKGDTSGFENNYGKPGKYTISSKIIAICDTCLVPVVACNTIQNNLKKVRIPTPSDTSGYSPDLASMQGELSDEQLRKIGFNPEPVLFGFDKTSISAQFKKMLDSNIVVLKKYYRLKVNVIGYTDSRGPASYNKVLSERRAKAVLNYLLGNGIQQSQIAGVKGKGENELLNDCDGSKPCKEAQHKKNRRVRVVVTSENIQP